MDRTILIIGGGIAGISCLETLIREFELGNRTYNKIILISESRLIRKVENLRISGRNLETFDVTETDFSQTEFLNRPDGLEIRFIVGSVKHVDVVKRAIIVYELDGSDHEYHYDCLSVCIGARPKNLDVPEVSDPSVKKRIVTLRDISSVDELRSRLVSCRRVVIIGNGGIALGLIDKISGCDRVWLSRDDFIGSPLLDSEAGHFLLDFAQNKNDAVPREASVSSDASVDQESRESHVRRYTGPSLGPNWLKFGGFKSNVESRNDLTILYGCQIECIENSKCNDWPLAIGLQDGRPLYCDLVVVAIGVEPNHLKVQHGDMMESEFDGGIIIDEQMRTSIEGIYAAGDVVSCERWHNKPLWFQMRLWTQARQMGDYCGKCIASHLVGADPSIYATFDCFTHVTEFFGKKVILLGRHNAQAMGDGKSSDVEVILRLKPAKEYVRLTLKSGVIIGALLVGNTDLEETIENLMHDATDVSEIKHQLLDDTVDIQDYFD